MIVACFTDLPHLAGAFCAVVQLQCSHCSLSPPQKFASRYASLHLTFIVEPALNYMRSGELPAEEISAAAKAVFFALKIDIDRVIRRRQRDAERRRKRREELCETKLEKSVDELFSRSNTETGSEQSDYTPQLPLSRQQRRALERARQRNERQSMRSSR